MQKHTSGPWTVEIRQHQHTISADWHGEQTAIASTQWTTRDEPYLSENIANARLIGAAPDMLIALESAERCLAWYDRNGANNIELAVVRHAIAKAIGS